MNKKFRSASLLAALSIIAVLSLAAYLLIFSGSKSGPDSGMRTYTVAEKTIRPYVSVSGEIFPDRYHELTFQVTGKVDEIYVSSGMRVKKGEPLARIVSDEREVSLKLAEINLKAAKERFNQTKKTYELQIKQASSSLSRISNEIEKLDEQVDVLESRIADLKEKYLLNPLPQLKEEIEKLESSLLTLKKQKESLEKSAEELKNSIANLESKRGSDLRLALYQVEQARLGYEKEKEANEKLTLYSPADGTVIFVGFKKGQQVGASAFPSAAAATQQTDSSSPSFFRRESIVVVEDNWLPETEVVLDQMDIVRIRPGLKAEALLDALPGVVLRGKVESVNLFPVQGSAGTSSYMATIVFSSKPEELVPGMSALIKVFLREKTGLAVPVTSLRYINGIPHVYVISNGRISERQVKVEESDDLYSIVVSGLKKGEKIVSDISYLDVERIENQDQGLQSPSRRRPLFRIFR